MVFPEPKSRQRFVCAATIAACLFVAQSAAAAAETAGPCRFEALAPHPLPPFSMAAACASPMAARSSSPGSTFRRTAGGRAALEHLVLGKDIALTAPSDTADRYGRVPAFAFVNGSETPVQYNLLALGQARVAPNVQDKACSEALFREERKPGRPDWLVGRSGLCRPRGGDGPAIKPLRGRFSVAEGRVVSVRESWSHDLCQFRKALVGGSHGHYPETT